MDADTRPHNEVLRMSNYRDYIPNTNPNLLAVCNADLVPILYWFNTTLGPEPIALSHLGLRAYGRELLAIYDQSTGYVYCRGGHIFKTLSEYREAKR